MKAPPPVASTCGPPSKQARDHARLAAAEIGLAVAGENVGNAHAGRLLDLGIGVDERDTEQGAASRRPIDDLPTPIMPMSTIERRSKRGRIAPLKPHWRHFV
jgi:hypothetical protein